jgi:hypothetical protein
MIYILCKYEVRLADILLDIRSSRSNSACGVSLVDSEVGAAAVTSDSQNQHQEGTSGAPIAWGGTHSTRQVSTVFKHLHVVKQNVIVSSDS